MEMKSEMDCYGLWFDFDHFDHFGLDFDHFCVGLGHCNPQNDFVNGWLICVEY